VLGADVSGSPGDQAQIGLAGDLDRVAAAGLSRLIDVLDPQMWPGALGELPHHPVVDLVGAGADLGQHRNLLARARGALVILRGGVEAFLGVLRLGVGT